MLYVGKMSVLFSPLKFRAHRVSHRKLFEALSARGKLSGVEIIIHLHAVPRLKRIHGTVLHCNVRFCDAMFKHTTFAPIRFAVYIDINMLQVPY
jgi:hypothetical protein